jgi:hypothetical protein
VIDTVRSAAVISSDSSGTVRLRHVEAPLRSQQNGSGDLVVGTIDSPAVELSMNSSGDAVLGKGTIGNLNARVFGSGDLVVAATAGNADLQASGGGDIKVGHVTGMLHKSAHGGSSIIVTDSDLASYGLGKMAQSAADDGDDITTSSGTHIHIHRSSSSGNGFHHFLAGIALLVILFAIWRTVQRGGGLGGLQNRFRGNSPPPAPSHPGVIAVRDTISRLEGRLARVEGYVTTREFDLQRKFRELDTKS